VKIIIDTHIFLWALAEPEKIDKKARKEIESLSNTIFVSSMTAAELMIKASLKKIEITFDPMEMIEKSGFEVLDFSGKDVLYLKEMPYYHKDPFDRMIIAQAQAQSNDFYIMSRDEKFKEYECKLI